MLLINPFTRQVLNAWTDEAREAALEARRRKSMHRSREGSKSLIHGMVDKLSNTKLDYYDIEDPRNLGGSVSIIRGPGPAKEASILVSKSPFERELAMHEIGHVATDEDLEERYAKVWKQVEEQMAKGDYPSPVDDDPDPEHEAWQWALKNARNFNLSKRKMRRLKRAADYTNERYELGEDLAE